MLVSTTTSTPTESREASPPAEPRWVDRLAVVSVVAAIVPIVVAAIRAIVDDWVAVGENAYFVIRSRDVLTDHHPLIGAWTSASITTDANMNHPGPLYFDVLALPVKVAGDAGLVVGVAMINVAAVVGMALVARRVAGARGVVAVMLAASGLAWAMGSELLFDPWQPHSLMLPFLCLLTLVWALATGDLVMLPWLVGVATFILQTHVGYALVVPLLVAWGVGVAGARLWQLRRGDPDRWRAQLHQALRCVGVGAAVAVLGWSQPLYEQLFGPGRGNLSLLASSSRVDQARVGFAEAPRFVAEIMAVPPWWSRPSVSESFGSVSARGAMPSRPVAVVGLLAVIGLLAGAVTIVRRRSPTAAIAAATGVVAVVASVVAVATMPIGYFGVAAHHLRWLWPVSLFVTAVLGLVAVEALGRRRGARIGVVALVLATVTLSALNLPSMNPHVGLTSVADSMPVIRELQPQLASLSDESGVFFDLTDVRFAEPYTGAVMSELQRLGVPWYADDAVTLRQMGGERAWPGGASVRLFIREGSRAREAPPGARRVAFAEGQLSDEDSTELAAIQEELTPFITSGGLQLTDQAAAEAQAAPSEDVIAGGVSDAQLRDPDYLFAWGTESTGYVRKLVYLVRSDRLDVSERWSTVLERYRELQDQADRLVVAVFVEPLEEDG
ncbi:MAG: hypothetical protein ACRD2C_20465 [Acidimicrobiales bacterium]